MQITLSPQRRDDVLVVSKAGDTLTINDEIFDFSVIPDGTSLPASAVNCEFVVGDVERIAGGDLHLTLILPHKANPSTACANPSAIINPTDGPLSLPE